MSRPDNTHHLRRAAAARHANAVARAETALEQLDRTGQPPTFSAVARAAHVSRSWLYTQPTLREAILRLRRRPTATDEMPLPAVQRATPESLRQRLDATRGEISRLRAENAALREQVARSLGANRARFLEDMSTTQTT